MLEELDKQGVETVYKKLLAYTNKRISLMFWQHNKETTTSGKLANDYVGEAILKAIDNNGTKWDRGKCPSLITYLIGLISNQLSNSVTSSENKLSSSMDISDESNSTRLVSSKYSPSAALELEDKNLIWGQRIKEYKKIVANLVKDDEDYVEFVFDEMIDGFKSQVIAERLSLDINEVYSYTRRIKSALKKKG